MSALKLAYLVFGLAPELKAAVTSLISAFATGDDEAARAAYEAARRAAFKARQK